MENIARKIVQHAGVINYQNNILNLSEHTRIKWIEDKSKKYL
jgi:hypothetical protein